MKVLQIASSNMEFFQEQVRILEKKGILCDVLYATTRDTNKHSNEEGFCANLMNAIYGHNPLYYALSVGSFYPKIIKQVIFNDYDVVHVNSGLVAPLGLAQPEKPVVTTFWGDDLLGDRLGGNQSKISKACAKRSTEVIVRSEEMSNALPCDAHIIPSGVDMEKFKPIERQEAINEVGWDNDSKQVLFPYHPSQQKKRYPVAKKLVESVDRMSSQDVEIQTVHGIPHDRMVYYFNASDVLLLPSLREGSPNTVKEAMACNLPVVATTVGDIKKRLSPVNHSYACDSIDEMESALQAVIQAGERSDGREHVQKVSLDSMGDRLISIYEDVA